MKTVRDRLLSRLVPDPETGCLLWTGCRNSKGYGCISVNGKVQLVHRVAWELERGPIPDGLPIDHVYAAGCRHRHCANVAHLEPVTHAENKRRDLAARLIPGSYRQYRWKSQPGPRPKPRTSPSPGYLQMLDDWLGDQPARP